MSVPTETSLNSDYNFLEMVFPDRANHYGTLYAGNALEILTRAAFATASIYTAKPVVMAEVLKVKFHSPVAVGTILEITANILNASRRSVTVGVSITNQNSENAAPVITGRFRMVAVDSAGHPTDVQKNLNMTCGKEICS